MNTDEHRLTNLVIGAAFEVSNTLGAGFLEKVYERALRRELAAKGVRAQTQVPYTVLYKGANVGAYFADLIVEEQVLVELKCVESLAPEHTAQCLNYLRASGLRLCLLLNFRHPKLQWKRLVL